MPTVTLRVVEIIDRKDRSRYLRIDLGNGETRDIWLSKRYCEVRQYFDQGARVIEALIEGWLAEKVGLAEYDIS